MANVNFCLVFLWGLIPITMTSHKNLSLAEVSVFLVQKHITNFTSTIVIAQHSTLAESRAANVVLLEYVLHNLGEKIAAQLYMHNYTAQPWEYYLFIVDTLEAFKEIYHGFQYNLYERHFRFLIVLTKYPSNFLYILEEIFKLCYRYDVIDVNVITNHPEMGISMYTYFLYSERVCRGCLPTLLYRFSDGLENLEKVFPEKMNNFQKCPFRVTSRILSPFLSFYGNASNPQPVGNWDNLYGIEGTLLKLLAQKLNFSIDLQPFPSERTYVEGNKTFGCFKELRSRKVDLAIGCFGGSNPSTWIFSPTNPFHNAPYLYVVRGRRSLTALSRLAQPFTYQVWILVAVFLILGIVITPLLKLKARQFVFGEENTNPVTNFLAVFLGYPVSRTPRRNFARFILLQLLLFTLVLRNAYQGSLYDAFRMDKFARIPTGYDDLLKYNYTIILPPETAELKLFPQKQTLKVNTDGFETRLEMLEGLNGKYVTVVIQDGFLHYLQKAVRNGSELILLPEAIYNYQFVMFLPKHSIYLNIFNKKLKEFSCAGITAKISSDSTIDPLTLKKLMNNPKTVALSSKRLMALYDIYIILMIISIGVFSLEQLSLRNARLRKFFMKVI